MHRELPDFDWTVYETIRCCPVTAHVFNDFEVDACCGGGATLDAAARDAGVGAEQLLTAIWCTIGGDASDNVGVIA